MLRLIGAVLAGYVTMFVLVFVTLTGSYLAMGADRAFQPGTYDITLLWLVVHTSLALLAAVAGGWVAASVSTHPRAPMALALFVMLLGMAMAVPAINAPVDPATMIRTGDVANLDAMMRAKSPTWVLLTNPLLGAVGALVGALLRGARGGGQGGPGGGGRAAAA